MRHLTPARLNEILVAANASRLPEAIDATTRLRDFLDREHLIGSDDAERHVHVPRDLEEIVDYPWRGETSSARA